MTRVLNASEVQYLLNDRCENPMRNYICVKVDLYSTASCHLQPDNLETDWSVPEAGRATVQDKAFGSAMNGTTMWQGPSYDLSSSHHN